ncbi:MAG: tail fiber protein [Bacteroidota bacterium]|nr:tail fiber protein [Bacteroidota bacterium]
MLTIGILSVSGFQSVKAQDGFIGEIRMFAGTFAPRYWMYCDGQLLSIASNTALFSILGTTYGGDGQTTFALPDLRGRVPIGPRTGPYLTERYLGEMSGEESVTLVSSQMPSHSHSYMQYADSTVGSSENPVGKYPARNAAGIPQYGLTPNTSLGGAGSVGYSGSSQPHNNMPPYTGINYIICVEGIFPSRP